MKKYLIKEVRMSGSCNQYRLYEDESLFGLEEKLKFIATITIEKNRQDYTKLTDEDIVEEVIMTLPNGTKGIFRLEREDD